MIAWWRLSRELDRWAACGRQPGLWWRDDDAAGVTPELLRLLALAARFELPLLLAVIPAQADTEALARCLRPYPAVFVAQHGVTHENRRRPGERDAEFPAWEAPEAIAAAVGAAWPWLAGLPRRLPVFVPPWNAVHPSLIAALDRLGLRLSAGGDAAAGVAHVQVDPLRWRPAPRFRGTAGCLDALRRQLRARRRAADWQRPIGLLTHHRAHDPATWRFLEVLLTRMGGDARLTWLSPAALFGGPGSVPGTSLVSN